MPNRIRARLRAPRVFMRPLKECSGRPSTVCAGFLPEALGWTGETGVPQGAFLVGVEQLDSKSGSRNQKCRISWEQFAPS